MPRQQRLMKEDIRSNRGANRPKMKGVEEHLKSDRPKNAHGRQQIGHARSVRRPLKNA